MEMKREASDNEDPASVSVLTDRSLFAHITSFMDGLPYRIFMFAKAERFRPRVEGRYPSSRGLLPQLAIILDDQAMLEAIYRFWKERHRLQIEQATLHNQTDAAPDPKEDAMDRELDFHTVIRCAVRFDRLHMLDWLWMRLPLYKYERDIMDIAVMHSSGTAIMEWVLMHAIRVREDYRQVSAWALRIVACSGQLDKLKWLHEHELQGFTPVVADAAASTGQLEVLAFLHEQQITHWSSHALVLAATNGHLEVVRYLYEHLGRDYSTTTARADQAMTRAALQGHYEIVAYLGQCGFEPQWGTLVDVVVARKLESLRALCLYTTEGCLFDARRIAKRYHHRTDMIALLSSQIASNVWFCSQRKHTHGSPRRCQRPREQHVEHDGGQEEGAAAAAIPVKSKS